MQKADGGRSIRPREERRRTVLPARLRNGAGWVDACILNISSRGLLIHAKCDAQPGSQISLWRGENLIVGRVVWRSTNRIGLCSPDPLPVDDVISGGAAPAAAPVATGDLKIERRTQPRSHERSRERSRAIEFVSLVLAGVALAAAASAYAYQALSNPLEAVQRALEPS